MNIKKVKILYKNRDISEIVNFRVRELEYELTIINNKIKVLKTFFKKNFLIIILQILSGVLMVQLQKF